jgi:hypothetical protein
MSKPSVPPRSARKPVPPRVTPVATPLNPPKTFRKPIPRPFFRTLRAFAFDPSSGRNYGNYMTLQVPFEDSLQPGPVGNYVAVVDYDAANKCYYEPVDLNDPRILGTNGLDPSESDPRFHQQMVYAVVSETIKRFKFALGRDIHWRRTGPPDSPLHGKLALLPHGIQEANAYYDPALHAILFGYFTVSETDPGNNMPGQTIFTCLSHDIVAHETTHAIVDRIRPYYMEATNQDVAAFHEAFADIVALFQHFSMKDAVTAALRSTGGTLFRPKLDAEVKAGEDGTIALVAQEKRDNPIIGLAGQFGDGIGLHGPLRSAIGTPPNSKALDNTTEPHQRGSILVAAIFDAFFSIYLRRTEDLFRIAGLSRDEVKDIQLYPELLARLADNASKIAAQFETLCIRALDYSPAVDITFGDYLRALITADHDLVHDDDWGYRGAIIDAFRSRGIRPEGVPSYSEESLLWNPPEECLFLPGLRMDSPYLSLEAKRAIQKSNAKRLYAFAKHHAGAFGISDTDCISVPSFYYVYRIGPDGNLLLELVAQVIEKGKNNSDKGDAPNTFGGVSLIFNTDGTVRYCIRKSLQSRNDDQAAFRRALWASSSLGTYGPYKNQPIDFRALHRGY